MKTTDALQSTLQAERRRRAVIAIAFVLPWALAIAVLAWYWRDNQAWLSPQAALLALVALATIGLRLSWRSASAVDEVWLARRMDAQRPDLQDSSALLFGSDAALPALARLQRARLQERLRLMPLAELRTPWPGRALLASVLLAIAALLIAALSNISISRSSQGSEPSRRTSSSAQQTQLVQQSLEVQPPSYTGLKPQRHDTLTAKAPEGSTLRWRLRFAPQPESVELIFHDHTRLALQRRGDDWVGSRALGKSTFYRLQLKSSLPMPAANVYRIDIIADRPPQIRVSQPDRTLIVLERKQAHWPLTFEASDDYGLGAAQLRITLAQGSGENINVSERTLTLPGQGDARRRSYRHRLDLGDLGFVIGDDLVVRLSVSDKRAPSPQTARSASFILRWPADAGAEATGVEGLVKRVLPAYFRSQRQIIIDSEALLAQRRKHTADDYLKHAEEIGIDQRILRLRYGEFLGQETSEVPRSPAPAPAANASVSGATEAADEHGHEEDTATPPSVLEAFGHTHDQPEAATLLDPETRALLKSALDQMWQAELNLRQGHVDKALPYEYRALRFIKQVQQASRIYLARVGVELPPVDESRRLSGDRKGLQSQRDALKTAQTDASPSLALWQALESGRARAASAELDAFEQWLRARESSLPDALDLFAALDEVRRDPDCVACATKLRSRLWPLLPARAPAVDSRGAPDRSGRVYLESLKPEGAP
jgi:hypothetical protein